MKREIKEKHEELKNTRTVSRGQLERFFENPSISSFAALQRCLFVYDEQYCELVDLSEKPEDLEINEFRIERMVFYVPDVAKALGRTEKAIYQLISREDWAAIPKPFSFGGKHAWRPVDVRRFIDRKAVEAPFTKRRGPGRPPKTKK